MTVKQYPTSLPYPKLGKQRQEQQMFDNTSVFSGDFRVRPLRTNSAVTWDITWRMNALQQIVFQTFLYSSIGVLRDGLSEPFEMLIYTEETQPVPHEVRIVSNVEANQYGNSLYEYSATVRAKELKRDSHINNTIDPEFILKYYADADILARTINVTATRL